MRWTWSGVEYEWTLEEGIRFEPMEGLDGSWTLSEGIKIEGHDPDLDEHVLFQWQLLEGLKVQALDEDIRVSYHLMFSVLACTPYLYAGTGLWVASAVLAGGMVLKSLFGDPDPWWVHALTTLSIIAALYTRWLVVVAEATVSDAQIRHPRWYGRVSLSWPWLTLTSFPLVAGWLMWWFLVVQEDLKVLREPQVWFLIALVVMSLPVMTGACLRVVLAVYRVLKPTWDRFEVLTRKIDELSEKLEEERATADMWEEAKAEID